MADGIPPRPSPDNDEARPPNGPGAPPPLTDIRVKGPGAKGLNKPAILIVIGCAVAIILVLGSNGLSSDRSKAPADTKPMMSDPARPEMAQGALRRLPADYRQAAIQQAQLLPASAPLLGPPLPGDVAAFAPDEPEPHRSSYDVLSGEAGDTTSEPADPAIAEAEEAGRSQLFFALRQEPEPATGPPQQTSAALRDPIAALRMAPRHQHDTSATSTRALFPGAVISASLLTAINSESPGPVVAQVTQAIYDSATGRALLIPQGARLVGDYKSSTRYGQGRIAIMWSRIIMPNGDEIALEEAAVDPSGAAGVRGKVDDHWLDVFGAAALGTLVNIGVASTEDPQLTYAGIGVVARDPVDAAMAEGVQRSASIVTNRVVDRSLAMPPTIRVEAGTRMSVIVSRTLAL